MNIIRIDSVSSTNATLKELVTQQELEEGTVLVATNQTKGRGQAGSSWESEPDKNLTFSILLFPDFLPMKQNFLLSELTALGIRNVLVKYADHIRIKWPNDIYYNDKKIAGILIENEIIGDEIIRSVIGVGLNVNQEAFESEAPNPVSLKQILGSDVDMEILLEEIVDQILTEYQNLQEGNFEFITQNYHEALYRNSGNHAFADQDGDFIASIESVSDDGFLHLLTDNGEQRKYAFKEVVYK